MNNKPIAPQDIRRRRALFIFQILIYGYLIALFLIQLHMKSVRNW